MGMIEGILTHTPVYVWLALAYLVWMGVQRMQPRRMRIQRVLIVPAIFILWAISSLFQRAEANPTIAIAWVVALALGLALGKIVPLETMLADRTHGLVEMPGSIVPLIRNLAVFIAKYAIGVLSAVAPLLRPDIPFIDMAISGLCAGFFVGWVTRLMLRYRKLPETDLTARPI